MTPNRFPAIVIPYEGRIGPTRGIDGDIATLQRLASACRMAMAANHVDETTRVMQQDDLSVRTYDCEGPTLFVSTTIASNLTRIFEFSIPETDRRRRRDAVVFDVPGRTSGTDPLDLITDRTLPVAASIMDAAAAMLSGHAPIGEDAMLDASHVLSMDVLRTHPGGPVAKGRTTLSRIPFDHQPETPFEPASLTWNGSDTHVPVPPPAFPATMTLRRGRGFMTFTPIFEPTLVGHAPDPMEALRAVSIVRRMMEDER